MVENNTQILLKGDIQPTPIDVIMPAHNNLELTMTCVKNLYNYTSLPFHLIVVDDSTDLTPLYFAQLAKEKDNITYIHSDEPYKSGNQFFNIGLANCKHEFVATVMNSIVVQPEWELVAVEILKKDLKVATVGLKCLFPWGTIESAGIEITQAMEFGGFQVAGLYPVDIGRNLPAHLLCNSYERQAVQWAFAIHRKEALLGNLDENLYNGFKGWDDIDNCFVLRKKGYRILYCGNAAGYHYPRATRGVQPTDEEGFRLNRENAATFRKRWGLEIKRNEQPSNRAERRRRAKK